MSRKTEAATRVSRDNMQAFSSGLAAPTPELNGTAVVLSDKNPKGVPPLPPVYVLPRKNIKRPKKGLPKHLGEGEDGTTDSANALSAGSPGGHRRAQ